VANFRIVGNAEVIGGTFQLLHRGPETGLEEINGDFLDAPGKAAMLLGRCATWKKPSLLGIPT
jgi:hypothetical protein